MRSTRVRRGRPPNNSPRSPPPTTSRPTTSARTGATSRTIFQRDALDGERRGGGGGRAGPARQRADAHDAGTRGGRRPPVRPASNVPAGATIAVTPCSVSQSADPCTAFAPQTWTCTIAPGVHELPRTRAAVPTAPFPGSTPPQAPPPAQTRRPPAQAQPPHARTQPPHARAQRPHARTQPRPAQAQPPHARAQPPYTWAQPPHAQARPPHARTRRPHPRAQRARGRARRPSPRAQPPRGWGRRACGWGCRLGEGGGKGCGGGEQRGERAEPQEGPRLAGGQARSARQRRIRRGGRTIGRRRWRLGLVGGAHCCEAGLCADVDAAAACSSTRTVTASRDGGRSRGA